MRVGERLTAAVLVGLVLVVGAGPAPGKDKPHSIATWLGNWTAGPEQDIVITRSGDDDALLIEGFASWGASDPERVAIGAIHVGEFTVVVPTSWVDVERHRLKFAVSTDGAVRPEAAGDHDCTIKLELTQAALVATDNMMCGGLNVTFNGTYRRQSR